MQTRAEDVGRTLSNKKNMTGIVVFMGEEPSASVSLGGGVLRGGLKGERNGNCVVGKELGTITEERFTSWKGGVIPTKEGKDAHSIGCSQKRRPPSIKGAERNVTQGSKYSLNEAL